MKKEVEEFFKNTSNADFYGVMNLLIYRVGNSESKAILTRFLKKVGLDKAYLNLIKDVDEPGFFIKCSNSEREILHKVQMIFVDLLLDRFGKLLMSKNEGKIKFLDMKIDLLNLYDSLNRSGSYMMGEKEDQKEYNRIKNINYD